MSENVDPGPGDIRPVQSINDLESKQPARALWTKSRANRRTGRSSRTGKISSIVACRANRTLIFETHPARSQPWALPVTEDLEICSAVGDGWHFKTGAAAGVRTPEVLSFPKNKSCQHARPSVACPAIIHPVCISLRYFVEWCSKHYASVVCSRLKYWVTQYCSNAPFLINITKKHKFSQWLFSTSPKPCSISLEFGLAIATSAQHCAWYLPMCLLEKANIHA